MTLHRWKRFFVDAGLPSDISDNYAIIFTENRIRFDMLDELNKEILYDMNIKKMGDVISILRHAKEVHSHSYRERVFKSDEEKSVEYSSTNTTPKTMIHQADSTNSSTNNNSNQRTATTGTGPTNRIVHLPPEARIVKPLTQQPKQILAKTTSTNQTAIIRNVTGFIIAPTRKRIEPPKDDDDSDNTPTSVKKNVKNDFMNNVSRNKIEAQSRLTNFSNQIQKAISSNSAGNKQVNQSASRQKLPIQSRLTTSSTNPGLLTKTIQNKSTQQTILKSLPASSNIKDRLGKKSVFERIDASSSLSTVRTGQRSVYNRLG